MSKREQERARRKERKRKRETDGEENKQDRVKLGQKVAKINREEYSFDV